MAVEYTIYCDDCGCIIHASKRSVRAARAEAQLQCGAVSSGGLDHCADCRKARHAQLRPGSSALDGAPSVGTQRKAPRP